MPQISKQLGTMNNGNSLSGLDLKNELLRHENVDSISDIQQLLTVINDRQAYFSLNGNTTLP